MLRLGPFAPVLLVAGGCVASQVRYQPTTAPPEELAGVETTLFLVGDAGEANPARDAVLAHLRSTVEERVVGGTDPEVVVVFLGDNIYEVGAREQHERQDRAQLNAQIDALGTGPNVRGVFVPGNHDWAKGDTDPRGRAAVRRQQEWLDAPDATNARLAPADACPGPATLDVGVRTHLVFVDTEWLIREPRDACGGAAAFYDRLRADLERHRDDRVILLSHHPFVSGGPHGGHVSPFDHGPLVYYLAVKAGMSIQDIASPRYSAMIRRFEEVFTGTGVTPLIHAAGHDHNLQVIGLGDGAARYQLVSGSASRTANARRIDGTRYATNGYGYMRLDLREADVRLTVFAGEVEGGPVRPVFQCTMSAQPALDDCPEAPLVGGGG